MQVLKGQLRPAQIAVVGVGHGHTTDPRSVDVLLPFSTALVENSHLEREKKTTRGLL